MLHPSVSFADSSPRRGALERPAIRGAGAMWRRDRKRNGFEPFLLAAVDNNDTVLYGCIRVALELQPSEENATLMKRVRQIGIWRIVE